MVQFKSGISGIKNYFKNCKLTSLVLSGEIPCYYFFKIIKNLTILSYHKYYY